MGVFLRSLGNKVCKKNRKKESSKWGGYLSKEKKGLGVIHLKGEEGTSSTVLGEVMGS